MPQNLTRFIAQSEEILNEEFRGEFDYLYYAEHCFDGVRAFALALNKTLQGNLIIMKNLVSNPSNTEFLFLMGKSQSCIHISCMVCAL